MNKDNFLSFIELFDLRHKSLVIVCLLVLHCLGRVDVRRK